MIKEYQQKIKTDKRNLFIKKTLKTRKPYLLLGVEKEEKTQYEPPKSMSQLQVFEVPSLAKCFSVVSTVAVGFNHLEPVKEKKSRVQEGMIFRR